MYIKYKEGIKSLCTSGFMLYFVSLHLIIIKSSFSFKM